MAVIQLSTSKVSAAASTITIAIAKSVAAIFLAGTIIKLNY